MIIISPSQLLEQSRRIANLHSAAPRNLEVLVIPEEQVYNEFGSGTPDLNALRRMLKMFYDRGNASGAEHTLKYVLLMGWRTSRPSQTDKCDGRKLSHHTADLAKRALRR